MHHFFFGLAAASALKIDCRLSERPLSTAFIAIEHLKFINFELRIAFDGGHRLPSESVEMIRDRDSGSLSAINRANGNNNALEASKRQLLIQSFDFSHCVRHLLRSQSARAQSGTSGRLVRCSQDS